MRSPFLYVFCFFACGVLAQAPDSRLHQVKLSANQQFSHRQEKARAFAAARQIPWEFNSAEGRHYLLVDVRNGIPVYWSGLNDEAAFTTNVVNVRTGGTVGLNLEGEGLTVGVWDEGLVKPHIELGDRILSTEGLNPKTHATHVTGTLIASGVNALAKGMAPKAKATTWYFDNDLSEMAGIAEAQALLVSNHSYGTTLGWQLVNNTWQWFGDPSIATSEDFRFGFYGDRAHKLDELAFAAPFYSIVWAAGNDRSQTGDGSRPPDCNGGTGYDCIIPESVAKNVITVGAINKVLNYASPASVFISTFSSGGPTDDGRIKPDLVAAGVNLFSLSADGDDTYTILSGTSMATPNVAGSLLLLQELYQKTHSGKSMKAATLKGLAIHTAREAGLAPGPDYTYGWGLLDAATAARVLSTEDGVNNLVIENTIEQGKTFEIMLNPKANQKITATLCWTDPAASPVADALDPTNLMLVNDLDLELISETGVVSYPWILDPNNPGAQATRGNNFRDNVEKLEFSLPQAKPYRLVVKHKGQLKNGRQDFSLIVNHVSSNPGRTLYWVGDSGNWSDSDHWATSSGGTPVPTTPTSLDVVIIDENSFDGVGDDRITLDQSVSCKAMRWLRTQPGSLQSQNNSITVSREFSASKGMTVDDKMTIVALSAETATGGLSLPKSGYFNANILVNGGSWDLDAGEIEQIDLNAGSLNFANKTITVHHFNSNTTNTRLLDVPGAKLYLLGSSSINGQQLTIESGMAELRMESTLALDWNEVVWNGTLAIDQGEITINGANNQFAKVDVDGSMTMGGSNYLGQLIAHGGSELALGNTTTQIIEDLELNGALAAPITISSAGSATLNLQQHELNCFDYLNISNVSVGGLGLINAGTNSTLANANGWAALPCSEVIFPDFEFRYACADGLTEFYDKSTGPISSYQWNFEGDSGQSTEEDPVHIFDEPGVYTVSLTISGMQQTRTHTSSVSVVSNTLPENHVTSNAMELASAIGAKTYQWLRDGEPIVGASQRTYAYAGQEGLFQVVTYDETCSRISMPAIITSTGEVFGDFQIYPNPVEKWLTIEGGSMGFSVQLKDLLGRVWHTQAASGKIGFSVEHLPAGFYLLSADIGEKKVTRKILVQHHP